MSALQVPAPADDIKRIEDMVAQFRSQIENLYSVAYIQGQIAQVESDRAKLRAEYEKVSA